MMKRTNIIEDAPTTIVPSLDFEAKHELNKQSAFNRDIIKDAGYCGCFHCGSSFKASEVQDWLKEQHGKDTALCPYCGVDAVIIGTEEYPLSTALLAKLYVEWFEKEYEKANEEGNSIPDYKGFDEFYRKGIPFRIEYDPSIKSVGSIKLFYLGWLDQDLCNCTPEDPDGSLAKMLLEVNSEDAADSFQASTNEGQSEHGSIISVRAYIDEDDYYYFEMLDSDGNELPFEPWSGDMEDLILDLTERYGDRLKGLLKSPYSDSLDLVVEAQASEYGRPM
ncbi:hypothetical protein [Anaerotardibacter muris]|uniref:hypothetical protein n=1 Tax=Anaerotardibacter muris TaxID=2941505 RepID=UPI00203F4E3D|nr:hypothetical protein [Anaerotardibacter muris]